MNREQVFHETVSIDIKELDEKPGPFCMSYGFDLNTIVSSIKAAGLINKPYIRRNRAGSIEIITGYRRIMALKALGWEAVPCIDLTDSGLSDKEMLILNLNDNSCTRRFNDVEKGMIINHLSIFFAMEDIYRDYMSLTGISSRHETYILARVSEFDDDAKHFIADGSISIKTTESLLEMKDPDRGEALKWITKLKLNFNQQMLFVEYINDISTREGKGLQELLNEETFTGIIMEFGHNVPQKAKRVIDLLRARRLPLLTRNVKAFAAQICELDLPRGVRIKHPPFFEGSDYLLEITFRDGKMLKETIDALSQIKRISSIRDPWKEE